MSTKTREGVEVKVGQVWEDEEGVRWSIRSNASGVLAMLEDIPIINNRRICLCGASDPFDLGWKLIKEP